MEITLADCLACSGCITSAESVLVTQQSQEELLRVFEENKTLKLVCSKNVIYTYLLKIQHYKMYKSASSVFVIFRNRV